MIKIKSFLQNIDNLIEPYKKWIMFLLVNLYYPFLNWFYGSIIPGYGPEANMGSSGPPNTQEIILIITIFLAIILYYILSNLVVFFSYKAKYKNMFLIGYNIFLLFLVYYKNTDWTKAYIKSIPFAIVASLFILLWLYLLVPLIYKLWKLPTNPAKKNAKTFF